MNKLDELLNADEEETLEEFLLSRDPDDTWQEGMDEGILTLSELDGFLTAIVSGPESVPPSHWLPALWGDFPPLWDSPEQASHTLGLIMRHMNGIAGTLMQQPDDFEPLFHVREFKDEVVIIPDEWCEGYLRAVSLTPQRWEAGGKELNALLGQVFMFTEAGGFAAQALPDAERDQVCDALPQVIRDIHAFWLARRMPAPAQTRRHESPPVGRNDPCPCGSGRKFKKCCLH